MSFVNIFSTIKIKVALKKYAAAKKFERHNKFSNFKNNKIEIQVEVIYLSERFINFLSTIQ